MQVIFLGREDYLEEQPTPVPLALENIMDRGPTGPKFIGHKKMNTTEMT